VIVVCDTSPINYLCQIGHIEILPEMFGSVVVPAAVAHELAHPAAPESVRQLIARAPRWLEIRTPNITNPLLAKLGAGEQQAILLAQELRADLLIADDKEARQAAERRQLTVSGTLGVLKLAALRQLIDLPQAIQKLQASGFHLSDELVNKLLGNPEDQLQ
jgi:predicted nucleic acid-binding protein